MSSKTIFISTGEVSGDLQGSLLVTALKQQAEQLGIAIEIVALGGSKMAAAGAKLLGDTTAIGSVGILEALAYVGPTIKVQKTAKEYLKSHPPDAIVLIDYMTPNLGIARLAKTNFPQVPIIYYIAPQQWVWSSSDNNTNLITNFSDIILAIFPEEARYFEQKGGKVKYVGHPLVDRVAKLPSRESTRQSLGISDDQLAIALIPASRQQEVKYLLPPMFAAAQKIQAKLPQVKFWIPLSREAYRESISQAIKDYNLNATLVTEDTDRVLCAADLAITKSGTVSLELALLNVPQVVIYRLGKGTAWIAKNLLKFSIPFMSPTNLVEMKPIVPELLQDEANPDRIAEESLALILNPDRRQRMLADYAEMRQVLGEPGICDRVAQEILNRL
jgi:lipid-A-disaccharide synthase